MNYKFGNKNYEVEEVGLGGAMVNVNGTTITNCCLMDKLTGNAHPSEPNTFSVFCDSDEVVFHSFEDAYQFATTEQKDTFRL